MASSWKKYDKNPKITRLEKKCGNVVQWPLILRNVD